MCQELTDLRPSVYHHWAWSSSIRGLIYYVDGVSSRRIIACVFMSRSRRRPPPIIEDSGLYFFVPAFLLLAVALVVARHTFPRPVVTSYASTCVVVTSASTPRGMAIVRALADAGVHRFVLSASSTAPPLWTSEIPARHWLAFGTENNTSTEDMLALANVAIAYASEGWHAATQPGDDKVWFAACDRIVLINNNEASATPSSWFEPQPIPMLGLSSDTSELIGANLLAPMALTRALLPAMLASELGGAVVNLVARVAGRSTDSSFATDSAVAAGLLGFTRALRAQAHEGHKRGGGSVTVSAVVDGVVSALGRGPTAPGDASDVQEVADAVVWAITYDEPVVQASSAWLAKVLGVAQVLFPRALELLAAAQSHMSRTPPLEGGGG